MDLTHADYLHPTTLGGGSWTQTPGKVTDNGNSLKIHWDSKNNVPFPLIAKALKIGNQTVDSFTEVEWFPASIIKLRKIGRAQVCTQVTNAHRVYSLMLAKKH